MVATATPTPFFRGAVDLSAATPTIRTSTATGNGSTTTAWSFFIPSGVVPGDVMYAMFSFSGLPTLTSVPAGWSLLASNSSPGWAGFVYTKVATALDAPGMNVAWSGPGAVTFSVMCIAVAGSDLNQPYAVGPVQASSASPASSVAFIAPMYGMGLIFLASNATPSTPSGWTLINSYTGSGASQVYAYRQTLNTQSVPAASFVATNTSYATYPIMVGGPPVATPPTTLYTSPGAGSQAVITELEMVNDDINAHTFRVVAGGKLLVPGMYVPPKGFSQYQLRSVMGASETLLAAANGPACSIAAHGVVTT